MGRGKLYIVGIGPGALNYLSGRAREAIKDSNTIIGYATYIRLLGNLIKGKEIISSGMRQEIERARCAIKMAEEGRKVALISGGDPGIYGMAGIVLELLSGKKIEIEIIPGISAASACAALLGAPLMNDFAVISLSDILTDRRLIEKRVMHAARADFVIVFYNPKSKRRTAPLKAAWDILMRHKSPETPVGIVRKAYRVGQKVEFTTLGDMPCSREIDMAATIIVGNSKTCLKGGYMITPRGYRI